MFKTFILIFSLFSFSLSAEIVKRIELNGSDRISLETIKVYGEIEIGKDYSSFDINKITKNLFETNFFEDINITLTNGTLVVSVKEYAIINFIDLKGEKSETVKSGIFKRLLLKTKGTFIESRLSQDINLIKKLYASVGFNFAKVEAKIEKFDDNRINLIYFLEKGKKTYIEKINFIHSNIPNPTH